MDIKILECIENMVDGAYEQVIEGEGIYSDFESSEIFVTPLIVDLFIDEIPKETIDKWKKKLRKKQLRDILTNSPDDYHVDEHGTFTWKEGTDVNDWLMQFFCDKIVKLYIKDNKVLSPEETFLRENPSSALNRYLGNEPMNSVEEYCFLLLNELLKEEYLPFAIGWGEITPERKDDFIQNWIDKLNNVY